MKLKAVINGQLEAIQPPDMKDHCRRGIYVCCKEGNGHNHDADPTVCGYHLWIYVGPSPVPHHNVLMARIRAEVPHVNGKGAHSG